METQLNLLLFCTFIGRKIQTFAFSLIETQLVFVFSLLFLFYTFTFSSQHVSLTNERLQAFPLVFNYKLSGTQKVLMGMIDRQINKYKNHLLQRDQQIRFSFFSALYLLAPPWHKPQKHNPKRAGILRFLSAFCPALS